jgi:iron(III) transport system substrate-binding protein
MRGRALLFLLLAGIVALPIIFRKSDNITIKTDDTLVVISPHTEFICEEFGQAFQKWYHERTGRTLWVDFRHIGGGTETQRFLDAVYENAFKFYWSKTLKKTWNHEVQVAYCKDIPLDDTPEDDTRAEAARRAFLNAPIHCGIDILFGGGNLLAQTQADRGQFIPSGIQDKHPEWFTEAIIPETWAGEATRDPQWRWIGAVYSSYGLVYNPKSLSKIQVHTPPTAWQDLSDGIFFGQLALSDPTKSGAAKRTFELVIQEQMYYALERQRAQLGEAVNLPKAIDEGWVEGLKVLQKIAANARYFTDKSTKPALDVASGDCAVGFIFDSYGRSQRQSIVERGGEDRIQFVIPQKGATLEPDPIALLKGAPHEAIGKLFIEFVLSPEGQCLWAYRKHTPNGPTGYALSRMPIRRDLYTPEHLQYFTDPDLNPYANPKQYTYQSQWTLPIYNALHAIIKGMCIDPHYELQQAWKAILKAKANHQDAAADNALSVLNDMTGLSYQTVATSITDTILHGDPLEMITLQASLARRFAKQYRTAQAIAEGNL